MADLSTASAARREPQLSLGSIVLYPVLRVVLAIYAGGAVALAVLAAALAGPSRAWMVPAAFLFGVVVWTFLEYVLHRWVLHWEPVDPRWRRLRRVMPGHRGHHNDPFRAEIVVNPKYHLGVIGGALVLALMLAAGVPSPVAVAALGGGWLGYAAYEFTHLAIHTLPMRPALARRLKQHHAIHHHRDETVNFGVTNPFWDHVFGTAFRPRRLGA